MRDGALRRCTVTSGTSTGDVLQRPAKFVQHRLLYWVIKFKNNRASLSPLWPDRSYGGDDVTVVYRTLCINTMFFTYDVKKNIYMLYVQHYTELHWNLPSYLGIFRLTLGSSELHWEPQPVYTPNDRCILITIQKIKNAWFFCDFI